MKISLRQFGRLKLLGIVVTLLLPLSTRAASLVNLGMLDIKPVSGGEYINLDLTPGQSVQQQLRVSNFSPDPMRLQIYTTDAVENSSQNYIANNKNELSRDISPWISLPAQQFDLASGATKILSVNVKTPGDAGVGLHTGAIMVSQKISSGENAENDIVLEKGVRIYANIKGVAAPALKLENTQVAQSDRFLTYSAQLSNSGNSDLNGSFVLKLLNQNNLIVGSQEQPAYLKPGESQALNLAIEKPQFGIFHVELSNNLINRQTRNTDLGLQIFFPPYSLPIIFGLALLFGALIIKKRITLPRFKVSLPDFPVLLNSLILQKILIFSAILLAAGFFSFNLNKFPGTFLKADLISGSQSYQTTIKWGNLFQHNLPDSLRTDWQGSIKFDNAIISVKDYLNQEATDQFILNADQNSLFFKNITGPDNDGVELIVTPTSSVDPIKITYKNNFSHEEISFPLEDTLTHTKSFDFKAHQISFSSATTDSRAENIITDQNATGEINNLQSSGEVVPVLQADQLAGEVKILQGIIEDMSSTPETLSEYILNSDYVQEVSSENQLTTVKADPTLINALQDFPNTIADMTGSKELNFIFIPDQKVRFLPQNFSFTEEKTVSQSLGRIIFVQNKTNEWNTSVSITNLVSISGKGSIPVSNVTVTPGEIKMISGNNLDNMIQAGPQKTPTSSGDDILLAKVAPQDGREAIFSLNPQFKIHIPSGTPPGIYRAQITIKVL